MQSRAIWCELHFLKRINISPCRAATCERRSITIRPGSCAGTSGAHWLFFSHSLFSLFCSSLSLVCQWVQCHPCDRADVYCWLPVVWQRRNGARQLHNISRRRPQVLRAARFLCLPQGAGTKRGAAAGPGKGYRAGHKPRPRVPARPPHRALGWVGFGETYWEMFLKQMQCIVRSAPL